MNDFNFSAVSDFKVAANERTDILSDILAFLRNSLPGLPLPNFFSSYVVSGARIEIQKTSNMGVTHPKNPNQLPQFVLTKPHNQKEPIIMPQEVNDKLTKFGQVYFACRFTILFLEYIKNPKNSVLPVIGTTDELQKTLVFYRDTPTNMRFLDFRLKDAEKFCLEHQPVKNIEDLLRVYNQALSTYQR